MEQNQEKQNNVIDEWLEVDAVAHLLGISERAVREKIAQGIYKARIKKGQGEKKGRPGWEIGLETLPIMARDKYYKIKGLTAKFKAESDEREEAARNLKLGTRNSKLKYHSLQELSQEQRDRIIVKMNFLKAMAARAGNPKDRRVIKKNITEFNQGRWGDEFLEIRGEVSVPSYYRWLKQCREQGARGLIDQRGMKKGIGEREKYRDEIKEMLFEKPHRKAQQIHRLLEHEYAESILSYASIYRVYRQIVSKNQEALCMLNEGEYGWKSKYQLAIGKAGANILQPNQCWEMDMTWADIICSDQKRYKAMGVIDIFTRRAQVLLVESSNHWAIAALLRVVFLKWGIPKAIKKDNGLEWKSNHLKDICLDLNIDLLKLPKHSPDKKPFIERFFGTLTDQFFSELSGYTGKNPEERPKEIRGLKEIVMPYSREEVQKRLDTWLEAVYHEEVHSGIGMRPREMLQVAQAEGWKARMPENVGANGHSPLLDLLLCPVGRYRVRKGCIHKEGREYYCPELPNGQYVEARQDPLNAGWLYVFNGDKQFIGLAEDWLAMGKTPAEIEKEKRRRRKEIRTEIRGYEQARKGKIPDKRHTEFLEAKQEQKPLMMPQPIQVFSHDQYKDTIAEIAEKHVEVIESPPEPNPVEEMQKNRPWFMTEKEKYDYLLKIQCFGGEIAPDDLKDMQEFEEGRIYSHQYYDYMREKWTNEAAERRRQIS